MRRKVSESVSAGRVARGDRLDVVRLPGEPASVIDSSEVLTTVGSGKFFVDAGGVGSGARCARTGLVTRRD
ncbi:MAG TPA: hypothetical protein VM866_02290 [Pyrinomonadaceae bacterium]|nr:hypothetical protein [Pyrinomonadaceae bacterium]